MRLPLLCLALLAATAASAQSGVAGYYRDPALHRETLVFAAEGDLWTVPLAGGVARRLTTHPSEERHPVISPDGQTLAFSARYEGPAEVYTMPLAGGLPQRRTYEGEGSAAATAFSPDGDLVYATTHYSTLPDLQLVRLNLQSSERSLVPLSQASEATYDASGKALYFVRPSFHNNVTRWYTGGWARQVWKFREGAGEAERLTLDHRGESHSPMWWNGRIYFVTDRDGTMNLWSMTEAGKDLRQHTNHNGMDVRQPALSEGRIAYVVGADLWVYDIAGNTRRMVPVTLASDLDQLREKWVTKPMQHLTSARLHPNGDSLVLTSRGRVFVAPARDGRWAQVSRQPGVRYRDAVFMPDGKSLLTLSDATGELEFVQLPVNGVGTPKRLTGDGKVLRFEGVPSPDGAWVVYADNNNDAWLLNVASKTQTLISRNREGVQGFSWSPDSRHVAFSQTALNTFQQIFIYDVQRRVHTALTSDRANSHDAVWSGDGKWIYFLSDRNLNSVVGAPWGPRQPDPFFDKPYKIYQVALRKGLRSPFRPTDELVPASGEKSLEEELEPAQPAIDPAQPDPQLPAPVEPLEKPDPDNVKPEDRRPAESAKAAAPIKVVKVKPAKEQTKPGAATAKLVRIDYDGLAERLYELPVPAGDYSSLALGDKAVYWLSRPVGVDAKAALMVLEITNRDPKPVRFAEDVRGYDLARNGKRVVLRREDDLFLVDAGAKALTGMELEKGKMKLAAWSYPIDVREDWRQIYLDAWRLERDYFYDPGMHGVDWNGVRDKYLPLVERVTTRDELSDVIGLAVGELSALHTSVREGDLRRGVDDVRVATLGARLSLDRKGGGYRIDHIYRADPEYPDERSPLADPQLGLSVGDVVTMVNGADVLTAPHLNALLRNQGRQQVLLRVKSASTGKQRDVVVTPMTEESSLRYTDWELTRRERVDELSAGKIGYVHLRAMTPADLTAWYRNFYPVFNRQGLIIDVRHNRGGNIDSFVLSKLLRKDWMYWQTRAGQPYSNMQYAFRGHMVVLVDEQTASDGEAFAEGFRRLGMGKVIGTRTWGGEIWLGASNRLSDGGYARAPSAGVYGPEGKWLIEQHGVDPDIVVDNPPHATFKGEDAQLDAAIRHLQELITKEPRNVPPPPPYPVVKPLRVQVAPSGGQPGTTEAAR
jgi:tricorn protease